MQKYLSITAILFFLPMFYVNAQFSFWSVPAMGAELLPPIENATPIDVIGTMYSDENWKFGEVEIDGRTWRKELRYNAYKDIFEMKEDGEILSLLKKENITLKLNNQVYRVESYKNEDNKITTAYLTQENTGKFILYSRIQKELKVGQKARNSYEKDKPFQFLDKEVFFIKINDQVAVEMPLEEKYILKNLPKEKIALAERFIKKNKLKIKNKEEAIILLNYLNSIES